GMYEIQLPTGIARLTLTQEGGGGLIGTMFMALTFTVISFNCVAPFYGGFIGLVAVPVGLLVTLRLGGLAFLATFASPLFRLAVLSLGFYLLPGLFTNAGGEAQRPSGAVFAWVEAFLLPDTADESEPRLTRPGGRAAPTGATESSDRLSWTGNLEKGLQAAL